MSGTKNRMVNLHTTKFYFLTYNNPKRRAHLLKEFKDYDTVEVHPLPHRSKFRSGVTGFLRMLDHGARLQDPAKPFQPFIMLEDDAKKYRPFPENIEIPKDTDILYIGISTYGRIRGNTINHGVCYTPINTEVARVYNMLSGHGLLICSSAGLLAVQKCLLEDFSRNRNYDICLAEVQPYYRVYALMRPLVYQYGMIGGTEGATKIEMSPTGRPFQPSWVNRTNLASVTATADKLC